MKLNFNKANMFIMLQQITNHCMTLDDKEYTIEIKKHRKTRSLSSNAYFHLMVDKISKTVNKSAEEVKIGMVLDYGALMTDENDNNVGFKLPKSVDVKSIYKYAKWFDTRKENDIEFNCYLIYKETHLLNSKEMANLIDGVVQEAQNLGIETLTPIELENLKTMGEIKCR